MEGMQHSQESDKEKRPEREPDRARRLMHKAIAGFKKVAAETIRAGVIVGTLVGGSPAAAEGQRVSNLDPRSTKIESQENIPTISIDSRILENTPERDARLASVRAIMEKKDLQLAELEEFLGDAADASLKLWTKALRLDENFDLKPSPYAIDIAAPRGTENFVRLANGENPDGNTFHVLYDVPDGKGGMRRAVFRMTARHNIPEGEPGWSFSDDSDTAARFVRFADKSDNYPYFSGKETTASVTGEYGVTLGQSQRRTEVDPKTQKIVKVSVDESPFTGELLPLDRIKDFYEFKTTKLKKRFPHMDFSKMKGGVCEVLPLQGFSDIDAAREIGKDFYRSGGAVVIYRDNWTPQLVGVQSITWKVGDFHLVCSAGPKEVKDTLDKAMHDASTS